MPRLMRYLESRALLLFCAGAAGLWLFLHVGGEMREGETLALDRRILLALRRPGDIAHPIGSQSFAEAMRDISALGGVTVIALVTIVATLVFLFHRKWVQAAVFLGATLTAELAAQVLKTVYDRPRPDLAPHGAYVHSASFPSGHTMTSATVYLMLAVLISTLEPRRPTKVLAFVVAIVLMACIGASRVYLAVHWPSDVLAGWAGGSGVALIAWSALLRLEKGRDRPKPTN